MLIDCQCDKYLVRISRESQEPETLFRNNAHLTANSHIHIYFWDYRIAKLRPELTGTPSLQLRGALGYAICVKDAIWFEPMSLLSMLEKQAIATAPHERNPVSVR